MRRDVPGRVFCASGTQRNTMAQPIEEIEGIGPAFGEKLKAMGVKTTDDLLKLCGDLKGRQASAQKTGITETLLLKWANRADLMRINGVGKQYSELLEMSGVDTVKELKTRRADNLTKKMLEVNTAKKLCKTNPSEKEVADWIAQAAKLPPTITH